MGYPWCYDGFPTEYKDVLPGDPRNQEGFNFGRTHFDHLPGALLVIFQCMTLEGWTDIMYVLQDAHSDGFTSLYFCVMIFMTNFFLLNIALAVIWEAFCELSEENKDETEEEGKEGEQGE